MKLFDFDYGASYAPKCNIFGQIAGGALQAAGQIAAAGINLEGQRETNDANIAMNDATNATNLTIAREANELSQAEADKAYERSTAQNQVDELVKAGYSIQQARQIVSGMGAASYTAAPIQAAQMNPGHADAPQFDPNAFNGFASAMSSLGADIDRADGGAIGQTLFGDISYDLQELEGYNPADIVSIQQFRKLANEKDDSGNYVRQSWHDFVNTEKFKSCARSMLGRRAFDNYHSSYVEQQNAVINVYRDGVQFDMDKIERDKAQLSLDMQNLLQQPEIDLALAEYKAKLDSLPYRKEYNQQYLQAHLQRVCEEETGQKILAEVLKMENEDYRNAYKGLGASRAFISSMRIYDKMGLTSTDLGTLLAWLESSGIPVTDTLRSAIESFKPSAGAVATKVREVGEKVSEGVSGVKQSVSNFVEESSAAAGTALENTGIFFHNAAHPFDRKPYKE